MGACNQPYKDREKLAQWLFGGRTAGHWELKEEENGEKKRSLYNKRRKCAL